MGTTKHRPEDVIEAIEGSGGIKTTIAERLGVHCHTIDNYLGRWPSVKQAFDDEVESVGDLAESVVVEAIRDGDVSSAKWFLSRVRRGRFATRQEHDLTAKGQPLKSYTVLAHPDMWPDPEK